MKRERNPNSPTTHHKSRKLKALENDEFFNFPEEIIAEILCRLPVKSIARFRCVSKSWLSLISSKRFVKTHLKVSTEDANSYRVLLTICYPQFALKQCSVRSLMSEQTLADAFNMDYPMKHPHKAVWVVGSCNGLICIAIDEKDLFLWNPAIKESTKLPSMDIETKPGYYTIYGFGFDESNDDYKVVGIFCLFEGGGRFESVVNIYSSKTDSWKRVEDFKGRFPLDDSGKFANGKIHWSATREVSSNLNWDIVSLDLEHEVYGKVDQPNYGEGEFNTTLGVLGGCICVLCNYEKSRVDVWVLKEYGVNGSWSKVFNFPHVCSNVGEFVYSKPICVLPNGEILLVFGKSFVICNLRCKSFRIDEKMDLDRFLEADVYVESLVSPAANGRLQRQQE